MDKQVWMGLLNSERVTRYYGLLHRRHRRCYVWLSLFAAVSPTGAAASLIAQLPDILSGIVVLLTVGVVAWLFINDHSGKAATASIFAQTYQNLAEDWRKLWYEGGGVAHRGPLLPVHLAPRVGH